MRGSPLAAFRTLVLLGLFLGASEFSPCEAQSALYFTKTNLLHGFNLQHRDRFWLEQHVSCDIYRLAPISPSGQVTRMTFRGTDEGGGARDPEVGPSGVFLYYSARESYNHGWRIWRRNLITGQESAITPEPPGDIWHDNMNPRVVGQNTIAFLSNRWNIFDEYGKVVTAQLWTMDINGGQQKALLGNLSGTVSIEAGEGGIITTDFGYRPLVAGTATKDNMLPWLQNLDGSGHRPIWGFDWTRPRNSNAGFQDQLYYKPSPDETRAVFTGSVRRYGHEDLAAGWLATTQLPVTGPEHPFQVITPSVPYDDPGPSLAGRFRRAVWKDNDTLVAVWSSGGVSNGEPPRWRLVTMNADGSAMAPLLEDLDNHILQPTVMTFRSLPASPPPATDPYTTFICDDALATEQEYVHMPFVPVDLNDDRTVPVRAHGIVGEGFRHRDFYHREPLDNTFIGDVKSQNIFRYLGSVPLEADGSFSMRVPADKPITFVLSNDVGLTTHVMSTHVRGGPGEVKRCGGCHTPTTPLKPLSQLLCPTDPAEVPLFETPIDVDFQDDIQPILLSKCTSCHSGPNPAMGLDLTHDRTLHHTMGFRSLSYVDGTRFGYPSWFDMRYTALGDQGFGGIDSMLMCMLTGTQIVGGKTLLEQRIAELWEDHAGLLNASEIETLSRWCSIPNLFGSFYRYVPASTPDLHNYPQPDSNLWPAVDDVFVAECQSCHDGVGTATPIHQFTVTWTSGKFALDGEYLDPTLVHAGFQVNFDAPAVQSPLLQRPLGVDGHPIIWDSPLRPGYQTVRNWIESGQNLGPSTEPLFRRGDTNGNGAADLGDGIHLLNYLFANGSALACFDAADADDDGQLGITDFIGIISWQFRGGVAPAYPYPSCGNDPTIDALGCAISHVCL